MDNEKEYFYYTCWTLEDDEDIETKVRICHSTWVSTRNPSEFLSDCIAENLVQYRRFKDEVEMLAFAKSVGLTND